ncbi:hypothetical protein tinsulaeT_10780 [Thalassotalea insulae]|uniref:DUF2141 domain-containing protein n=1 Tax=Thalassotalea insulae TaxID=2056778 RepID=A0ABQ6GP19_9GAMM|nr:DUF2141 domain-containing protein [Thalassotalea insulae]GLX77738.1 hypothetical protein tinsulaeT_10780 [Thalassotalea insulae]
MTNTVTLTEQSNKWREAEVIISNIDTTRGGDIVILIYQKDGFPKDHAKALKRYKIVPKNKTQTLQINIPKGAFAIKVHHDQLKLNKVRKNWTRILPADGLGFSAGAKIRFGPPSFNAAKIQQPKNGKIKITMVYP